MIIEKILDLKRELIRNGMSGNLRILLDSPYDVRKLESMIQKEKQVPPINYSIGSYASTNIEGIEFVSTSPRFTIVYARSEKLSVELEFEISRRLARDLEMGLTCLISVPVKGYYFTNGNYESFAPNRTYQTIIRWGGEVYNKYMVILQEEFFQIWVKGCPHENENPEISANIFRDAFKDALLKYGE